MKKFFLLFALILIFSVLGCGKKSENQTTPEQNDADETAETADNEENDTDTEEDSDETSDSEPSDCDEETPEQPDGEMPECSPESGTPCKDPTSGLMWSSIYYDNWHQKKCSEISEGGYTDWYVPEISQLMTLVQNCQNIENGGCEMSTSSKYSKLCDTETLWSITTDLYFLTINFSNASIEKHCNTFFAIMVDDSGYPYMPPDNDYDCSDMASYNDCYECFKSHALRCTRCDEGYFWYAADKVCAKSPCKDDFCAELPHSTGICYPSTPEIYRCGCEGDEGYFWYAADKICAKSPCKDDYCAEIPHSTGLCYPITPETYGCRCESNYSWNGKECVLD